MRASSEIHRGGPELKLKRLMLATTAVALVGCAHASGFTGKWIVARGDTPRLIITNQGQGHYTMVEQRAVFVGARLTWVKVAVCELTREGAQLKGHLTQLPEATFTLTQLGPERIVFTSPDRGIFGPPLAFRRTH